MPPPSQLCIDCGSQADRSACQMSGDCHGKFPDERTIVRFEDCEISGKQHLHHFVPLAGDKSLYNQSPTSLRSRAKGAQDTLSLDIHRLRYSIVPWSQLGTANSSTSARNAAYANLVLLAWERRGFASMQNLQASPGGSRAGAR